MRKPNAGKKVAQTSWVAAILFFVMQSVLIDGQSDLVTRRAIGALLIGLVLIGLGCGIYSLISIRKFGTRGILVPGLIGFIVNGLLITGFMFSLLNTDEDHKRILLEKIVEKSQAKGAEFANFSNGLLKLDVYQENGVVVYDYILSSDLISSNNNDLQSLVMSKGELLDAIRQSPHLSSFIKAMKYDVSFLYRYLSPSGKVLSQITLSREDFGI